MTFARRLRPWQVVGFAGLVYVAVTLARYGGDPRAFAVICPDVSQIPTGRCGYDGQFAYFIAIDPAGSAPRMDVPAYRYQRILYPTLARVVGLGQAGLIAWTLILVNLGALMVGTALVEIILIDFDASRWYALAYGFFAGVMMPVRLDLTEPMAYALALGGVLSAQRGHHASSGALLALTALTKETALLFTVAVVVSQAIRRRFRAAFTVGLLAILPFVLWQLALKTRFGQFGVGSGGALGTPFEIIPLRGLWSLASIDVRAFAVVALLMLPMAVAPALLGLAAVGRDALRGRVDAPMLVLMLNAALVLFTPQSTFREPLGMARLTVGLVAATLIYAAARRSRRGLNYSLLWIFTLALALNESNLPVP